MNRTNQQEKYTFIVPVAGPIHGVKYISKKIIDNIHLEDLTVIDTAQAQKSQDFGRLSFSKIREAFNLFQKILVIKSGSIIYLNLTPHGYAFYRDIIFLLLLKVKKCNITVHIHANGLENKNHFLLQKLFVNTKILVINELQQKRLNFLSNVFLLNNSLPSLVNDDFEAIWSKRNFKTLLYFSNISFEKGIFEAIEIFQSIEKDDPDVQLHVYGRFLNKEVETEFNQIIKGNSNIIYKGFVDSDRQKAAIFRNASIFLFLSKPYYEVYPLALLEALMFGLPIIMTEQVIVDIILKNKNGFLIKKNNYNEAVSYISILLNNNEQLRKASLNSYNLFKNQFAFSAYLDQLKSILKFKI